MDYNDGVRDVDIPRRGSTPQSEARLMAWIDDLESEGQTRNKIYTAPLNSRGLPAFEHDLPPKDTKLT